MYIVLDRPSNDNDKFQKIIDEMNVVLEKMELCNSILHDNLSIVRARAERSFAGCETAQEMAEDGVLTFQKP